MSYRSIFCLALLFAACKAPAPSPAPAAPAAPSSRPSIPEADARALLDRWLAAQNTANLQAYSDLYATDFFGTKRSGKRTKQFDRAGWLTDRKPNFSRPLTVSATDITVTTTTDTAEVRFTQDWASASFRDVGQKILVLRPENGALKITKEEMLDSKVLDAKEIAPPAPEDFRFVVHGKRSYLLVSKPAPAVPKQGRTLTKSEDSDSFASVALPAEKLPSELQTWPGKRVHVLDDAGVRCQATVYGAVALARAFLAFEGYPEDQSATGIFDVVGPADTWLAFELEPDRGADCTKGFWARSADRPAPMLIRGVKTRVSSALDHAFVAAKGWKANNADFKRTVPSATGRWDAFEGGEVQMVTFAGTTGGDSYWAGTWVGDPHAGEWSGSFWGLWQKTAEGYTVITDESSTDFSFSPLFAADLDGDGTTEFVAETVLYRKTGPVWRAGLHSAGEFIGGE